MEGLAFSLEQRLVHEAFALLVLCFEPPPWRPIVGFGLLLDLLQSREDITRRRQKAALILDPFDDLEVWVSFPGFVKGII
jgi:hypothetical protein